MYTKKIYVVIWQDRYTGIMVGHLPFYVIPEGSILRDALFSTGHCLNIDSNGGLQGIYEDKSLAEEHMKIESGWRSSEMSERTRFWINTIESRKADSKDKYI